LSETGAHDTRFKLFELSHPRRSEWGFCWRSTARPLCSIEFERNVVEGRLTIHVRHVQHSWIVIVGPDAHAKLLVVVTVYEVSND
jgi:hypothetical protein